MGPDSKTLRMGAGKSSSREVASAVSKPKAKKGSFADADYHGFFIAGGRIRIFTTHGGVRYVDPRPVVVKKLLTPIGSGLLNWKMKT